MKAVALFFLACVCALAAAQETVISVDVSNTHDKPVVNAAVILDFKGEHQVMKLGKRRPVHWEVHTDEHGHAQFPPVPHGTVELQVIAKDYQTFGQTFDVDTDQKSVDIKLQRPTKQYSVYGNK